MSRPTVRSFLVVVLLLTLLVSLAPFAQAAPEYVSAVVITSPTNAAKAYVHAGGPLQVAYDVTTADATGPAHANFYLGSTALATNVPIASLNLGVNYLTQALTIPGGTAEATYDVMVEVRQDIVQSNWVQAVQNYAVVVDNTPPTIKTTTLTVPNGGESWMLGSAKTITWAAVDVTDVNLGATPIGIYLSMDGGATWPTQITAGVANGGSFAWTVGGGIGTQMRVKLVATDKAGNAVLDISDANFTIYGTDSTPPVPTLIAPATGAFISGTAYQVKGTAIDGQSGIVSVLFEYSADGTTWSGIGPGALTGTPNEYAVNWNTTGLADGTVVWVRETATNGVGASATSVNNNITIDNSAPSIALTAPAAGAFVSGNAVNVAANAADLQSGVTQVLFEYKTAAATTWLTIGTDMAAPWQQPWNTTGLADGAYDLRATATNGAGATTQSAVVSVTVDNTKPALTPPVLGTPNKGEVWQMGVSHVITWTAGAITDINLLPNPVTLLLSSDGGTNFPVTIAAGLPNSGSFTWTPTGLVPGSNYLVKLEVKDKAGNSSSDVGNNTQFTLWNQDSTAPQVALTAPANGAFVTGAVPVTASASDPESGILSMTLWYSPTFGTWTQINGALTAPPYSLNWDTTTGVTDGPAKLKAKAKNGVGLETESAIVNVTIDNSPPVVNLVQPANGTTIFGPASPLLATANDVQSGVTEVKFWYAVSPCSTWTLIGAGAPTANPGEYGGSWNTAALADGPYCVKAEAKSGVALTGANPSTIVTIKNIYTTPLVPGWNLISLPVVPYSTDIEVALADLKAHGSVKQVTTFVWEGGVLRQKIWSLGPKTLTTMVDGQAYWIEMTAPDNLVVHGAPNLPPPAVPPAYGVKTGWNMLGFKSTVAITPAAYLGPAITPTISAMYGYNTVTGNFFTPGLPATPLLTPGLGYWLAVNSDGTVYP